MLGGLVKNIKKWQNKKGHDYLDPFEAEKKDIFELTGNLNEDLQKFKDAFGNAGDLKTHEFVIGQNIKINACLIYIDGLVKNEQLSDNIVRPLVNAELPKPEKQAKEDFYPHFLKSTVIYSADIKITDSSEDAISGCLGGDTLLIMSGEKKSLIISTKGYAERSITEPQSELVVRGPREGYTENFRTNTSLLRRKIRNHQLRMDSFVIGKKTCTNVCVAYIDGVANPNLVKNVKNRLKSINVDSIFDAGYIEQYIEDSPISIFPTINYTEKPDVTAAKILEGRVAILVDGSPFALTAPMLFIENFQTAEDYYIRPIYASLLRILRLFSYFFSIFLVPIYVAMTVYHQELIPSTLLFTITKAREGTPFPAVIEALILILSFEILRESGLRLPRPVGQAISIVGALVMGDAAVAAGLVGAPMVIAVALSSVTGFVTPAQIDSITIFRLFILFLSATLGGFGIAMGFLVMIIHIAALKSFGVPYFTTFVISRDMQDGFIRMPLWAMNKRPKDIAYGDTTRVQTFVPPVNEHQESKDDSTSEGEEK